jgi:hypothetical protein
LSIAGLFCPVWDQAVLWHLKVSQHEITAEKPEVKVDPIPYKNVIPRAAPIVAANPSERGETSDHANKNMIPRGMKIAVDNAGKSP